MVSLLAALDGVIVVAEASPDVELGTVGDRNGVGSTV